MSTQFSGAASRAARLGRAIVICLVFTSPRAQAGRQTFQLSAPVACDIGRDCIVQNYVDHGRDGQARDYHCGALTYRGHKGSDFRVRDMRAQHEGVSVLAAAEGVVLRVRDGIPDVGSRGITAARARRQECGNGAVISHGDGWQTQYCHLAMGSLLVKPGDHVNSGRPIGLVGLSGATEFPHLHLTVRRNGQVIDPFAYGAKPDACDGGVSLWAPPLQALLKYRERIVFNTGFTSRLPITMKAIESGEVRQDLQPGNARVLSAFVRTVGLRAGDVQRLRIEAPDKRIIADHTARPVDRNKAQAMLYVGVRRPASGWPGGAYVAHYSVRHSGRVVIEQSFAVEF
jgi:hypothetical protein